MLFRFVFFGFYFSKFDLSIFRFDPSGCYLFVFCSSPLNLKTYNESDQCPPEPKQIQIQQWLLVINDGSVLDQVQNQSKPTHEQPYITLSFLHSQITVVTRDSVAIIIVSLGGGGGTASFT